MSSNPEETHVPTLLYSLGPSADSAFDYQLRLSEDDKKKFDDLAGQVPLGPDSACLTTFITPFGRFYFKRLPFGITSAPEIFQKRLTNFLDHLPGVFVYMDDIIVSGRTREEHDRNLVAVLDILWKANVMLNMTKCHKCQAEVKLLGHIFSGKVSTLTQQVSSVANLKPPKNVKELRSTASSTGA